MFLVVSAVSVCQSTPPPPIIHRSVIHLDIHWSVVSCPVGPVQGRLGTTPIQPLCSVVWDYGLSWGVTSWTQNICKMGTWALFGTSVMKRSVKPGLWRTWGAVGKIGVSPEIYLVQHVKIVQRWTTLAFNINKI